MMARADLVGWFVGTVLLLGCGPQEAGLAAGGSAGAEEALLDREDPPCDEIPAVFATCEVEAGCRLRRATRFDVSGEALDLQSGARLPVGSRRPVHGFSGVRARVSGARGSTSAVELAAAEDGWAFPAPPPRSRFATCLAERGCTVYRTADVSSPRSMTVDRRVPARTRLEVLHAVPGWLLVSHPLSEEGNAVEVLRADGAEWYAVQTRGCIPYRLDSPDAEVVTPDLMEDALLRHTGNDPDACERTAATRPECAVRVYRAVWETWQREFEPTHGPLTFGALMAMVYAYEVAQMVAFAPRGEGVTQEAFGRNTWQICRDEGCNPERLLIYLASKQAWYARANPGGNPRVTRAWIEEALESREATEEALADAVWRRQGRGSGVRPYEWATWGYGMPGYDSVMSGRVAGQRVPFAIRYCRDNGGGAGYDYVAAIVSAAQDEQLPSPSTAGTPGPNCQSTLVSLDTGL